MLLVVTETETQIYCFSYDPIFILIQVYSTWLQKLSKIQNIPSTEILIFLPTFELILHTFLYNA